MKNTLKIGALLFGTFFLSGCSLPSSIIPTKNTMANATVMRSDDSGTSWVPKMKIDEKKTISGIDILSMAVNPIDSSIVYIGTESNGLFVTKNSGETWTQEPYLKKVYSIIYNSKNTNIMYGTGLLNSRAKIFKRLAPDQEWKEIYTEPEEGTIISTLAIDNTNPEVIYAGTSEGVIIKTTDGGQTWVNLKKATGPVISIGFDSANSSHVFFGIFQVGVMETKNAGGSIEDISNLVDTAKHTKSVYTLVTDPYLGGVVYVGTGAGIFRRSGNDTWTEMNLIESSKAFPVRSIAVNPKNSKEIMYSSARAIYKSVDSGAKWSTFQLDTSKEISALKYNLQDPTKIYTGLRTFK